MATLLRVMYKQLRTKAHAMDILSRGLIPRRELARYAKYISPEFLNQSDDELAASASQGILFKTVLRRSFDDATTQDHDAPLDLDTMFSALRVLNRRLDQVTNKEWLAKPARVKYDVGQIFTHKKWGFRGVIVDWFEVCPGDERWAALYGPFNDGLSQPFYRCLIHREDRPPEGFVSLAAQENLIAVLPDDDMPVDHQYVENFFTDEVVNGRHLLLEERWSDFPDN